MLGDEMQSMRNEISPIVSDRAPEASARAISSCRSPLEDALISSARHRVLPQTSALLVILASWCCVTQAQPSKGQIQPPEPQRPQERTDLYGDRLPAGAVARLGSLRFWLGHPITSVAFSPDGAYLTAASAGHCSTLRVWAASTGRIAHILPARDAALAEGNGVRTVTFSPDGKELVAGCDDGCIRIWEWPTAQLAHVLKAHDSFVTSIAFAPDGKSVASGGDEGRIKLWDVETGKESRAFPGFREGVVGIAFCPIGPILAAASHDRTVRVWNVAMGNERRGFSHKTLINGIALGPDGKTLALSEGTAFEVQQLNTGAEIWRGRASIGDAFRTLAYSPDGKTVASGSESGELRLWEVASGKEVRRVALRKPVDAVAFSPDGTKIASGGDLMARLWDVATGMETVSYPSHDGAVRSFAFPPTKRR